ncbi:type II secretion system F family protein [Paraburkholderia pallida]|uniref:Pilus assembly protein n=1 Tax=Paraburkholderia pallida TaxID=2547399 RepID=A0A4P7D3Z2_9BURK|nr:type II secretion system F family protein [Paraburkholderia pallida]QBR01254.1 pilus assembly protein [Paraburkholderia pallida]
MTPADIVTAGAFLGALIVGMIVSTLRDARRAQPEVRIRARLREWQARQLAQRPDDTTAAELFRLGSPEGRLDTQYRRYRQRLNTVGGKHATTWLALAALGGFVFSLVLARLPWVNGALVPCAFVALPALGVVMAYRTLNRRFRQRFLKAFPDTLDMVLRAVRAGVPVTHAIANAAEQADEPVRAEFRIMGDALKLGIDVVEVLEAANARIEIPDFAFFSVCLRLQRETGGQLGETLENLAIIIRARRDVQMKTRALTAEGRMSSQLIAAVPFFIAASLYMLNPAYIETLFTTELGHKMLAVAAVLLTFGLTIVNRMARLETSR